MRTDEHSTVTGAPRAMVPVLAAAAFVIFAQIFMIAPVLPALAQAFSTTAGHIGLAIPLYLIPHGVLTLAWGPISDRFGRRRVIMGSLIAFVVLAVLTTLAPTANAFLAMRMVTAFAASGVVPIALALVGDLIPYQQRGHALGWLFGGMAGGMAFGAAGGALAEPLLGWRGLFGVAAAFGLVLLIAATVLRAIPSHAEAAEAPVASSDGYSALLRTARGRRTYGYVLINALVQSGIYSWFGLFLHVHYGLDEVGIGLAMLGYGLPGFVLGPVIGRAADRWGRARVIPAGVALTSVCAFALAAPLPAIGAQIAIVLLSLGYDMTQPPLAGIVTDLPGSRGKAMGFNAFTLFTGFGIGALIFQIAFTWTDFTTAFLLFGGAAAIAALAAIPLFRSERPTEHQD